MLVRIVELPCLPQPGRVLRLPVENLLSGARARRNLLNDLRFIAAWLTSLAVPPIRLRVCTGRCTGRGPPSAANAGLYDLAGGRVNDLVAVLRPRAQPRVAVYTPCGR